MYYHVFVKRNCPHCVSAVKLLKRRELEYVVSSMEKAPQVLKKLQEGVGHETVPLIFSVTEDDKYALIGGYDSLKRMFEDENSSEQKTTPEEVQEQIINR